MLQVFSLRLEEYIAAAGELLGALNGEVTVVGSLAKRQAVTEAWVAVGRGPRQQPLTVQKAPRVASLARRGPPEARDDHAIILCVVGRDVLRTAAEVVIIVGVLHMDRAAVLEPVGTFVEKEPVAAA